MGPIPDGGFDGVEVFFPRGIILCDRAFLDEDAQLVGLCRKVDSNKLLSTMSSIFRAQTFHHMV
jgi:hypothetical protein